MNPLPTATLSMISASSPSRSSPSSSASRKRKSSSSSRTVLDENIKKCRSDVKHLRKLLEEERMNEQKLQQHGIKQIQEKNSVDSSMTQDILVDMIRRFRKRKDKKKMKKLQQQLEEQERQF